MEEQPLQPTNPTIMPPSSPYVTGSGMAAAQMGRKKLVTWLVTGVVLLVAVLGTTLWLMSRSEKLGAEAATAAVSIDNSGFTPSTIKIKKGQGVTWTNKDEAVHQVFADQKVTPGLDSVDVLNKGDSYIFTFDKAGTYNYYDPLNPTQYKATVIVE